MKKWIVLVFSLVCIASLLSCAGKSDGISELPEEASSQNLISSDMLGEGVYEALQEDWDAWNVLDEFQKMASSHMPGHCYVRFDEWEECEEFLGFNLFNPLENSDWPEKGTYVAMPEGYNEAPRFYVSFYGTREGQVEWIRVKSGYRNDQIRITVNAQVFVDLPKENMDDKEPLITEDSGERYVASEALLARGPITYSIRVIGEPNMQTQVKETLEKVLPYFSDNSDK